MNVSKEKLARFCKKICDEAKANGCADFWFRVCRGKPMYPHRRYLRRLLAARYGSASLFYDGWLQVRWVS